jgi:hypothetical protein
MLNITIEQLKQLKPSDCLQDMVDGLREHSQLDNFKVSMSIFGEFYPETNICCACAATIALCKRLEVTYPEIHQNGLRIHEIVMDEDPELGEMIHKFEVAMDSARFGYLSELFSICGASGYEPSYAHRFALYTNTWENQLPLVENLITELKAKGV